MTQIPRKNVSVPLLAVAAIALCWAIFVLWPSPNGTDATGEKAAIPEAETTPEPPAPKVSSTFEQPEAAGESAWPTYHGGPALTGLANATLPDKPEVLWRYQASAAVYFTPVACGERIYFATDDGAVVSLDYEGNEVWTRRLVRTTQPDGKERPERFEAPVACFDSTVLAGAVRGKLYAFDAASGADKWVYDVGGPMLGTVNLHRSRDAANPLQVLALDQSGGALHSIDLATGEALWQTEGVDRCDGSPSVSGDDIVFGSCAAALHIYSATDGHLVRNIELDRDSQVAGGVALAGDSVFSGSNSGRLFHANLRTGKIVWTNEDSMDEVFTTPAVSRDRVVFTSYDGNVYALDRGTGQRLWTFETKGIPTSPVIAGERVLFGSDGVLYLLRIDTGEKIWSHEISDEITSPAIVGGMIVAGSDDGIVIAFGVSGS